MSSRLHRLAAAGLIAAGAGTFGYAAGGLAGTDQHLRAAEGAPVREYHQVEDPDRLCPRDRPAPPSEL
jgi:hypothetical protein